jgi:hypothetical protein
MKPKPILNRRPGIAIAGCALAFSAELAEPGAADLESGVHGDSRRLDPCAASRILLRGAAGLGARLWVFTAFLRLRSRRFANTNVRPEVSRQRLFRDRND